MKESQAPVLRVGLMRHFPVVEGFPGGWLTAAELHAWRERYELSGITVEAFDLAGVSWQVCLASDLPRARSTASTVFAGAIEHTPLLREARMEPFRTGRLRLPIHGWKWLYRFAWLSGHASQRECRDDLHNRVRAVADRLCEASRDTLVVSHAGLMHYLSAELRRRGFRGPSFKLAEHAKAYTFVAPDRGRGDER